MAINFIFRLVIVTAITSSFGVAKKGDFMDAWAVELHDDAIGSHSVDEIAAMHGFANLGQVGSLRGHYHFKHLCQGKGESGGCINRTHHSHHHTQKLATHPQVKWAEQQTVISRRRRSIVMIPAKVIPDVERLRARRSMDIQDPYYDRQWNIENTKLPGHDMNIKPVWELGITGKDVVVTIVDDGMEHDHPDLIDNYDAAASTDVNGNDDDPYPDTDHEINNHGTRCSGVIGSSKNTVCNIGIAYESNIGAVRMLDGVVNDMVEAKALGHAQGYVDIYSSSWGPNDDGRTIEGPAKLAAKAISDGIQYGRSGMGSIYVFASGNGGRSGDSCNCDGYCNSIYTIAIGALTEHNTKPSYSEPCSATMAVAYSSGDGRSIVTTTIHHGCTTGFSGTSAAAPQAAGIFALVLQARPELTWRDVQHLIVLNSDVVAESDSMWNKNAAGHMFNNKFGFGRLNALKLVNAAKTWNLVDFQRKATFTAENSLTVKKAHEFVKSSITIGASDTSIESLEHVQIHIQATTVKRGLLYLDLECPDGTRSNLLSDRVRDRTNNALMWTFMTVECWGENALGTYSLHATVLEAGASADIMSWGISIHGTGNGPAIQTNTNTNDDAVKITKKKSTRR